MRSCTRCGSICGASRRRRTVADDIAPRPGCRAARRSIGRSRDAASSVARCRARANAYFGGTRAVRREVLAGTRPTTGAVASSGARCGQRDRRHRRASVRAVALTTRYCPHDDRHRLEPSAGAGDSRRWSAGRMRRRPVAAIRGRQRRHRLLLTGASSTFTMRRRLHCIASSTGSRACA